MALVFPSNPNVNDTYTVNGRTYVWNGTTWRTIKAPVPDALPTLSVDNDFSAGGTLHVDSVNNEIGIGTAAPSHQLHLTQDLGVDGDVIAYDTLSVGASASITGDLTVGGDFTVSGTTTTISTTELLVEDNLVTLNSGATGSPTLDAGVEVERGDEPTVAIKWSETDDAWHYTNDGTLYDPIGTPAGSINVYAGTTEPAGWLICDGREVSRTTYARLFATLGGVSSYPYGLGNGSTTFNLPNLKGKVVVGVDPSDTDFDAVGDAGGAKTHTLTTSEMPSHTHTQNSHNHTQNAHTHTQNSHSHGASTSNGGHYHAQQARWQGATGYVGVQLDPNTYANTYYWGSTATASGSFSGGGWSSSGVTVNGATATNQNTTATNNNTTATNQNTGGGNAHNNLQPYVALNYIIKT